MKVYLGVVFIFLLSLLMSSPTTSSYIYSLRMWVGEDIRQQKEDNSRGFSWKEIDNKRNGLSLTSLSFYS